MSLALPNCLIVFTKFFCLHREDAGQVGSNESRLSLHDIHLLGLLRDALLISGDHIRDNQLSFGNLDAHFDDGNF